MAKVADKQEMDPAAIKPEEKPQVDPKQEAAPEEKDAGAEAADAAAPAGAQSEEPAAKKQAAPHIRIASPTSGDAYPMATKLPIVVECEGEGTFDAQLQLRNSKGISRAQLNMPVDLGKEGKGSAEFVIDLKALLSEAGGASDQSGTYQLHAFGADGSGKMAPMSRINIDIIDEERAQTPNMPKDVANAPAGDKPAD